VREGLLGGAALFLSIAFGLLLRRFAPPICDHCGKPFLCRRRPVHMHERGVGEHD
jgi:hypothetical protein